MPGALLPGETVWLDALAVQDLDSGYVVSDNYRFEVYHEILSETTRNKFLAAQNQVKSRMTALLPPSAFDLYNSALGVDREFWTAGPSVTLEPPLVTVKDGRTIYREKWSFLSGLPQDPDEETIELALGDVAREHPNEPGEHRSLKRGALMDDCLSKGLRDNSVRNQINQDMIERGFGGLKPEDAGSWDSHATYQNGIVRGGYIPICWVTPYAALEAKLALARREDWAALAAVALGLSNAKPGVYYAVVLPESESDGHDLHKPTILSGGFPDCYCAVLPQTSPGETAQLGTGDPGLPEAVMPPLDPSTPWPGLIRLGQITTSLPDANPVRIRQRLKIERADNE